MQLSSMKSEIASNSAEAVVQMHVMHSWGGGLERWVTDYCSNDNSRINLVLKSIGIPGIPGQYLYLYQNINDSKPIQTWKLTSPIYATSITNREYGEILETIIRQFRVDAIIISSLIGHCLDILNTSLETIYVCHDYYPFCPAINIYFRKICRQCQAEDLKLCFEQNSYNRFFPEIESSSWLPIRQMFLELIITNKITLVVPSNSIKQNLIELEPQFKRVKFVTITHGINFNIPKLPTNFEQLPNRRLKIVILGSLAPHKGFDLFKEILPAITDIADIYLLGYGDEGKTSELKQVNLVAKKYTKDNLTNYLNQISPDIGLLLSVWPETFSYTLSELMSYGIPTLTTKIGSFAERIQDEKNGFLAAPNPEEIVAKIKYLHQHPKTLFQVADHLKNSSHKTVETMIKEYHQLIDLKPSMKPKYNQFIVPKMTEAEWQRIQSQLAKIDRLQAQIQAMETSKFWKMRKAWFKLKRILNLPIIE